MILSGEQKPSDIEPQLVIPVVYGTPINIPYSASGVETNTLPDNIARRVSRQILKALGEFGLSPNQVRFSGYDSPDDLAHTKKAQGIDGKGNLDDILGDDYYDFENADRSVEEMEELSREDAVSMAASRQTRPADHYTYYFAGHTELSDGQDGPLTYATGPTPAIGVYDYQKLLALGYGDDGDDQVTTSPYTLRETMVFEFRPLYVPKIIPNV